MAMKSIIFKENNLTITSEELCIINIITSIDKIFVEGDTLNLGLTCKKKTAEEIIDLLRKSDNDWYLLDGEWTDEDEEYYQQELEKSQNKSEYPIEYEHEDNKIVQFSENSFTAYVYADPFDDECEEIIEETFKSLDEAKSYIDNHLNEEYIKDRMHDIALNKTYDDGIELERHQMYWYEQGLVDGCKYAKKLTLLI